MNYLTYAAASRSTNHPRQTPRCKYLSNQLDLVSLAAVRPKPVYADRQRELEQRRLVGRQSAQRRRRRGSDRCTPGSAP